MKQMILINRIKLCFVRTIATYIYDTLIVIITHTQQWSTTIEYRVHTCNNDTYIASIVDIYRCLSLPRR